MSYIGTGVNDANMNGTLDTGISDPCSLACWIKVANHPVAFQVALMLCATFNAGNFNDSYALRTNSTDNIFHVRCQDNAAGASTAAATLTNGTVDGIWLPWIGTISAGDNGRDVYVGAQSGTNGATRTVASALTKIIVGASAALSQEFVGRIAEVCVWDGVLSAPNIASYIAGIDPSIIDAGNLRAFYPLRTDTGTSIANLGLDTGGDLSVTDWAFDADHPTIITGGQAATIYSKLLAGQLSGLIH